MSMNTNIKIEYVAEIDFKYPYLELFYKTDKSPFLEIGISDDKQLTFKIYASKNNLMLSEEEWEMILYKSKEFLTKAIKNEDDYIKHFGP